MKLKELSRGSGALLVAYALVAVATLVTAVWSPATEALLKTQHLSHDSYLVWALLQPLPKMYHSDNQYSADLEMLAGSEPRRTNHYPARVLTFSNAGQVLARAEAQGHLILRSEYRGTCVLTVYRLEGSAEPRRVTSEALEGSAIDAAVALPRPCPEAE